MMINIKNRLKINFLIAFLFLFTVFLYLLIFNVDSEDIFFYKDNDLYFSRDIDINNDNILDKIFSSKPYQGDDLILLIQKNGKYKLALKTMNFSEDGGNQIVDIKPSRSGFIIVTAFPDRGFFESHFYISLVDDQWILTNTIYKTKSGNQEDSFLYVCDVQQNINLSTPDPEHDLKWIPDESRREEMCLKNNS